MPRRWLRDTIITSPRVDKLPPPEEVFYRRLMSVVDDFGRFDGRPVVIKAACYPLRLHKIREADISRWLAVCERAGLIVLYEVDGNPYVWLLNLGKPRATASKFPDPPNAALLRAQKWRAPEGDERVTKATTKAFDAAAASLALDEDEEADELLDLEGFPDDDPLREHEFFSLAQVKVAVANADYLKQIGKLGNRRGYIADAISKRYALLDGVGRQQMQADKSERSKLASVSKAKQSRDEQQAREITEREEIMCLKALPEDQLVELKLRAMATAPNSIVRASMERKPDPIENPVLRSAILSLLAAPHG